jgi:hypothetical protein
MLLAPGVPSHESRSLNDAADIALRPRSNSFSDIEVIIREIEGKSATELAVLAVLIGLDVDPCLFSGVLIESIAAAMAEWRAASEA